MKKKTSQFNFRVNDAEGKIIEELREKYAINLSGAFKLFLKQLLEKMERQDVEGS